MQRREVHLGWTKQDKERQRMDPEGQKHSNQHSDKGLELSGINLIPYLLFFCLPCPKSLGVGWVGIFCILELTLNKIIKVIQRYSLVSERPTKFYFLDVQWCECYRYVQEGAGKMQRLQGWRSRRKSPQGHQTLVWDRDARRCLRISFQLTSCLEGLLLILLLDGSCRLR